MTILCCKVQPKWPIILAVHFRKTRMEIMLVMTNLTNNYARKIYQSLHFASVYTPCCLLLGVVAQSLKPVKLLRPQLPTFLLFRDWRSVPLQCWIRLHFCTALPTKSYRLYPYRNALQVPILLVNCCVCLHVALRMFKLLCRILN